jgi:hypothetical protein
MYGAEPKGDAAIMRIGILIKGFVLIVGFGLFALPSAQAQFAQPLPLAPQSSVPCDAFHKNENGTWSPTRQVTITSPNGSISIGPGVSFGSGVQFAGINLYVLLEQNCR